MDSDHMKYAHLDNEDLLNDFVDAVDRRNDGLTSYISDMHHQEYRALRDEVEKRLDAGALFSAKMHAAMPCGHKYKYLSASDEGTNYCVMCELEACLLETKGE